MNYLEQLAAEWYEYSGYFVRTNVRARKRKKGGWDKELDVLAFKPDICELVHIETSGSAESVSEHIDSFNKKFDFGLDEYEKIIGTKINHLEQVAVSGWSRTTKLKLTLKNEVKVFLIPEFLNMIIVGLHSHDFISAAIPENFPLLRTIQMMDKFQDKKALEKKIKT